jgi:transposase-like protein
VARPANGHERARRSPTAEERLAAELVARAREQGVSLTGPDALLEQLTRTVIEMALNQELTEHLGHEKREPAGSRGRERAQRDSAEDGADREQRRGRHRRAARPGRDLRA